METPHRTREYRGEGAPVAIQVVSLTTMGSHLDEEGVSLQTRTTAGPSRDYIEKWAQGEVGG